jgi:hypothetical protein
MKILLTAAAVLFALVAAQVSAEEEIDAEKEFKDWAAFIDGGDCWIATLFEHKKADEVLSTYYFVTFHNRSPQPRISIIPSSDYNTDLMLPLIVGGVTYELEMFEGAAFPIDDEEEMSIFRKMLDSEPVSFTLKHGDGESHELDVSYLGFRDAYNYLSRACEFDYTPGLSDVEGVEPT